jgi:hypothetical protein
MLCLLSFPLGLIRVNALSLANSIAMLDTLALSAAGIHALQGLAVLMLGQGGRLVGAGHVGCLLVLPSYVSGGGIHCAGSSMTP